ncbi:M23 family metallopeptidase [Fictibacillus aquaticus]|uniref:M23ase beta-sheet core domain-containing protein n=1 Tax=Fictibacillus aquaticus TaxID=2021314 RepID=A0A235FC29_9BACL|nr:M23 family metallopeptidase [Fictibacillus aquaticus]OYD58497.1 hypothetical protein CGZ90_00935 [Fictibacillus aquaticus]
MRFKVTSPYGAWEEFRERAHTGIDLATPQGTDLFSPISGVVERIVDYGSENIGKGIIIETNDHQHVILGHLSEVKTKIGEHIDIGDLIAKTGNTGHVIGNGHLHIGMKDSAGHFINPQPVADIVNQSNVWDSVKEFIFTPLSPLGELLKDYGMSIGFHMVGSEIFFLIPAVLLLLFRMMIGKNFTSGWVLPLLYAFFVTKNIGA